MATSSRTTHATLADEPGGPSSSKSAKQMDAEASGTDNGWDPIDLTSTDRYSHASPACPDLFRPV